MTDREFQLKLVQMNFVIFGGIISGIKLGADYYKYHVAVGAALLGVTALFQYLSLLSEFGIITRSDNINDIEKQNKKLNNWYIILGCTSYIFILFGFIYPHLFSENLAGATIPFIFILLIYILRILLLDNHPEKELAPFDLLVLFLLFLLIGMVTFGVVGAL